MIAMNFLAKSESIESACKLQLDILHAKLKESVGIYVEIVQQCSTTHVNN